MCCLKYAREQQYKSDIVSAGSVLAFADDHARARRAYFHMSRPPYK